MNLTKIAIYARVSTNEGRQHLMNQLRQLRTYATAQRWKVVEEFTDEETGDKENRPGLDRMLTAASRKAFDIVLVFDLSRLTRRGPASAFKILERLKAGNVDLWSFREEYFRTAGIAGPILIAIAAFLAEQERVAISHRVQAGMDRARAAGQTFGPPELDIDVPALLQARAEGLSVRKLAKRFEISKSTVQRTLEKHAQETSESKTVPEATSQGNKASPSDNGTTKRTRRISRRKRADPTKKRTRRD